jgi:hypothetical protein
MDFFVWGFVKDKVFVPPLPANVVELRTRITAAVFRVRSSTTFAWHEHFIFSEFPKQNITLNRNYPR